MANSIAFATRRVAVASIASAVGILATLGLAYFSDPKISLRDVSIAAAVEAAAAEAAPAQADQRSSGIRPGTRSSKLFGLFV